MPERISRPAGTESKARVLLDAEGPDLVPSNPPETFAGFL